MPPVAGRGEEFRPSFALPGQPRRLSLHGKMVASGFGRSENGGVASNWVGGSLRGWRCQPLFV